MACRLASLALAFALTACVTKPAKTPTIVLDPVVVTAEPFCGAWKNAAWDKVLISAIESEWLLALRPSDAQAFSLKPKSAAAWARLLVEVARFESGFVPSKRYIENFKDSKGQLIISSGLFQISLESSRGYGCKLAAQAELFDAETNIRCAVKIFARLVRNAGRIAGQADGKWRGGAAYWAVLRGRNDYEKKALAAIRAANKRD